MISVAEALAHLFDLATPLETEVVPLKQANGRVLAKDAIACRDQPPFSASSMDGYAVRNADVKTGVTLTMIGESAAGHRFDGAIRPGECIRIFTGAPLPEGADRIIIQEDVTAEDDQITIGDSLDSNPYVRAKGFDFKDGEAVAAPKTLRPSDIALLAAMNISEVTVTRKPKVAILSTGDELVMPGETPSEDQIIASNSFGLYAMLKDIGAEPRLLPIARDNEASLKTAFSLANDADLLVTIGGASVGDHDLVGDVAADLGMERSFYKIAMRPGKPLMAGRLANGAMMIGLPGNPVSAMVCGKIFLEPVVRTMLGLGKAPAPEFTAPLAQDVKANGPREHYMRASLENRSVTIFDRQDSALLSVLADANTLVIRPPNDPARKAGELMRCVAL